MVRAQVHTTSSRPSCAGAGKLDHFLRGEA
jgi:hypothetical protein